MGRKERTRAVVVFTDEGSVAGSIVPHVKRIINRILILPTQGFQPRIKNPRPQTTRSRGLGTHSLTFARLALWLIAGEFLPVAVRPRLLAGPDAEQSRG